MRERSSHALDRVTSSFGYPGIPLSAAAMLLTLPGIPGIYIGEELGAAYEPYKDAVPIDWGTFSGLRDWYTRLIALRHEHPALYSRDIRMLDLAAGENVLAYPRSAGTASETILVLLNYVLSAQVTIPSDVAEKMHGRGLRDLLTGRP